MDARLGARMGDRRVRMLPGSSPERVSREAYQGGRAKEISAWWAGLCARSSTCPSSGSDGPGRLRRHRGGRRHPHRRHHRGLGGPPRRPRGGGARWLVNADAPIDHVAAVSVGIVDGEVLLDIEYESDVAADVDMNVVMSGRGELVEVQGTAEHKTFTRKQLNAMLDLAQQGIEQLIELQRQAVE